MADTLDAVSVTGVVCTSAPPASMQALPEFDSVAARFKVSFVSTVADETVSRAIATGVADTVGFGVGLAVGVGVGVAGFGVADGAGVGDGDGFGNVTVNVVGEQTGHCAGDGATSGTGSDRVMSIVHAPLALITSAEYANRVKTFMQSSSCVQQQAMRQLRTTSARRTRSELQARCGTVQAPACSKSENNNAAVHAHDGSHRDQALG